jgi:hypothetical protein
VTVLRVIWNEVYAGYYGCEGYLVRYMRIITVTRVVWVIRIELYADYYGY